MSGCRDQRTNRHRCGRPSADPSATGSAARLDRQVRHSNLGDHRQAPSSASVFRPIQMISWESSFDKASQWPSRLMPSSYSQRCPATGFEERRCPGAACRQEHSIIQRHSRSPALSSGRTRSECTRRTDTAADRLMHVGQSPATGPMPANRMAGQP